ncbi:hypothetical protein Rsub_07591 [Raphidocelis subcapitata]|uniref:DUF7148 domain-containing protein n=1 Tax=Raphidocelis subcapitata TaxID=307507 RepID=A0A2V0P4C1_9CHLO|nr:hypothetical protein Rsub_07591 [Raphidocelis subcapitata]|eukprot:GBF94708.1 hypothetical protein Rsub_07591 [Raphidocelis subcapitata]
MLASSASRQAARPFGAARAASRAAAPRRARAARCSAAAVPSADSPHIQLATAKIPAAADEGAFMTSIYQHVATLNQNGRNLPFVLPLKVDRLGDGGFSLGLLRRAGDGGFASAVDIIGCVESVEGAGRVLFLRMFEGPAAFAGRAYNGKPEDRLEAVIQAHPDVDTIMGTMVPAIRMAAAFAMTKA